MTEQTEKDILDLVEAGSMRNKDLEVGADGWITDPRNGLKAAQVERSLEIYGKNEIPAESTPLFVLFLRQFLGFLPLLIEIAALVSLGIGDYADFGIIFGILLINAILGFREEYHAKKSLDELAGSIESEITVLRNGGQATTIPATEIVPGDICLLVGGSVVPADVKWIQGDSMSIDTAALTGEPIPRKYPSDEYGDVLLSGTTVKAGECYGQVLATGANTEIGKAQEDVLKDKSVRIVSVFQQKIMIVVQCLISMSLIVVLGVILVEGIVYDGFRINVKASILDALGILISAIPVALPLVLQVNLALGASFLAKKHHAIVTSIPALQDIASMSVLCSDKTGTLTTAKMSIIPERIHAAEGFTTDDVMLYAYLCSNPDKKDDPIDRAVVTAFRESSTAKAVRTDLYAQDKLAGFNPEVKRTVAFVTVDKKRTITIAKGLPAKIMDTSNGGKDTHEIQWKVDKADDGRFIKEITDIDKDLSKAGYKTIAVAMADGDARTNNQLVWKFVGLMPMLDPPRVDTKQTIESLHSANISVKMITGDHVNVGRETARLIGMGTNIQPGEAVRNPNMNEHDKKQLIWDADGFAAVLPSDKREVVLTLRNDFGLVTGMTGDGVNDAPALSAAQVGIAVEGATDAAKNAADLLLTEPGLNPIFGAVLESRRIFARIKAYVVYRIAASIALVLSLSAIIFASGCAVDSLLVIILALLNDISMIPVAYDNAEATAKPQLPNAGKLVLTSLFFGVFHTGLCLLFIFSLEHSDALQHPITLDRQCSSETRGYIWLYLVLVTEFMIFSARAPKYFFQSMPSMVLLASVLLTCVGGTLIATLGSDLHWDDVAWIWLYNLGAFLVVDVVKVFFKQMIGEAAGEIIKDDDDYDDDENDAKVGDASVEKTEAKLQVEKKLRQIVHRASAMSPQDMTHAIEVTEGKTDLFSQWAQQVTEMRSVSITDGFIVKKQNILSTAYPNV